MLISNTEGCLPVPVRKKCQVIESMGQILLSGSLLCVILWIYLSVQKQNFALQQSSLSPTVAIDNDGNLCISAGSENIYLSCKEEVNEKSILSSDPKAIPGGIAVHTERQHWYSLLRQICLEFNDSRPAYVPNLRSS